MTIATGAIQPPLSAPALSWVRDTFGGTDQMGMKARCWLVEYQPVFKIPV